MNLQSVDFCSIWSLQVLYLVNKKSGATNFRGGQGHWQDEATMERELTCFMFFFFTSVLMHTSCLMYCLDKRLNTTMFLF